MDGKGGCSGRRRRPLTRRSARSLSWAGALLALAAGGIFASAQAADHERSTAEMTEAFACASAVRLGYDVSYAQELGSFAVVGVEVKSFPEHCTGRTVRVELLDDDGVSLGLTLLELADGGSAGFGAVDAREVATLRVHPG